MAVNFLPHTPQAARSDAKVGAKDEDSGDKLASFSNTLAVAFGTAVPSREKAAAAKASGDGREDAPSEDAQSSATMPADVLATQLAAFGVPIDAGTNVRDAARGTDGHAIRRGAPDAGALASASVVGGNAETQAGVESTPTLVDALRTSVATRAAGKDTAAAALADGRAAQPVDAREVAGEPSHALLGPLADAIAAAGNRTADPVAQGASLPIARPALVTDAAIAAPVDGPAEAAVKDGRSPAMRDVANAIAANTRAAVDGARPLLTAGEVANATLAGTSAVAVAGTTNAPPQAAAELSRGLDDVLAPQASGQIAASAARDGAPARERGAATSFTLPAASASRKPADESTTRDSVARDMPRDAISSPWQATTAAGGKSALGSTAATSFASRAGDDRATGATSNVTANAAAGLPLPDARIGTTAAPVIVKVDTPAFSAGWHQQVAQELTQLVVLRQDRAEIHLHPAELGPVTVQIVIEGDRANVSIQASQASTREGLESALPQLRDNLAQQGITLGDTSVRDQRQPQQEAFQQRATPYVEAQNATAPDTTPGAPAEKRIARGLIDLFA